MASWHVTRIDFADRISRRRVEALRRELQAHDYDFKMPDVDVYGDGIRGMWRSPLWLPYELRDCLVRYGITTTRWIFEPRHCTAAAGWCGCAKLGPRYGCIRAVCP